MTRFIQTDKFSHSLRNRGIDTENRRLLMTRFPGTEQAEDLSEPPNCNGYGRIRHFKRFYNQRWPDPLPLDPACLSLKRPFVDEFRAQVFQNAVCNWRCWYCFVDFKLLSGDLRYSDWLSADGLVDLYLQQQNPPSMIDLSGGQPDLTPEWVVWMMEALAHRDLADSVFLWSDDNLSTDYLWRYLTPAQLQTLREYSMYGRVACFKGFDPESFAFNTLAEPALYERQFDLFGRLLDLGINLYAYVTFTTPSLQQVGDKVKTFVDRLQDLHELLPLRTVPLRIEAFTPTASRMNNLHVRAIDDQERVLDLWNRELSDRFDSTLRGKAITDLKMSTE